MTPTERHTNALAQIGRLRELVHTPLPWVEDRGEVAVWFEAHQEFGPICAPLVDGDRALIVAAVNMLPAVLDEAEKVLTLHRPSPYQPSHCSLNTDPCADGPWPCNEALAQLHILERADS